jgi:hypothetical protein
MKLLYILLIPYTYSLLIPNNQKICKDCKYFFGDSKKCKYFSDVDLVTGKKNYKYAEIMRKYDDDCGKDGKHFEINKIKFITVPYYFIKEYWSIIIVSLFTFLYLYASLSINYIKK